MPSQDEVAPAAESKPSPPTTPTWRKAVSWGAWGYVGFSMASSILYLTVLQPAFANDIWWAKYSSSGYQALLVDQFNKMLTTHASGDFDILAPHLTMDKTYNAPVATTNVWPTYVRRLVRNELTTVEYAVDNLRTLDPYQSMWMFTQYCWVDLKRDFELAHTASRQQRCYDRYTTNGAVYMETTIRNQVWEDFIGTFGGDGGMFTVSIQDWLEQTPHGRQWIASTSTARATTTVAGEAAYWKAHGIQSFELQWLNYWHTGISETMVIQNALGMQQEIVLKNMPRTDESWTSVVMFWMPINDLNTMMGAGRSLIRSANNSFLQPPAVDMEVYIGVQDASGNFVNQVASFRNSVGSFISVDTYYVAVPSAVVALYEAFQTTLHGQLATNADLRAAVDAIASVKLNAIPSHWIDPNLVYYGGNPMCLTSSPQPYIQQSFGFFDACTLQAPLTVALSKYSSLFAALVTDSYASLPLAKSCHADVQHCRDALRQVTSVFAAISSSMSKATTPLVKPATDAVTGLRVGLMQFASDATATNWTLLRHGLLDDPAWSFYGWSMIYDWVEGKREVVSFQGDVSTLTLMSVADTPQLFTSSNDSVKSATMLIFYLTAYVTLVLLVVASTCFLWLVAIRFQSHGTNFYWFNRLVGSIWVGRPLLVVRGVTAILMLSTTQLSMAQTANHAWFEFSPRSWVFTIIITGEATWVLYCANDFLSIATNQLTKLYCPLSSFSAWLALIILEATSPVQPVAKLNRHCTSHNMDQAVKCTSGQLYVGSFERVGVIFAIQGIALVAGLIAGCLVQYYTKAKYKPPSAERHVLGIADLFLQSSSSASNTTKNGSDNFAVDKASCIMAGFVPFFWFKTSYTFDVKLWVIHVEKQASRTSKVFVAHRRSLQSAYAPDVAVPSSEPATMATKVERFIQKAGALVASAYAVGAIVGSVSYLQVTKVNLANDLFWANFNMTGAHAFTANYMNEQLSLGVSDAVFRMDNSTINEFGAFDQPKATVQAVTSAGSELQYSQLNTIDATIQGLRSTSACSVPWIFTQYCYVDFDKRWVLANTDARQKRCEKMTTNGAVFLETVLRNVRATEFRLCWGDAFDVAIGGELERTQAGRDWLAKTMQDTFPLSVQEEGALWKSKQIESFDTQWQNYKRIGLINSYTVSNLYGLAYPFTLQYQNTTYRLEKQTMFKMYWGLANDLMAVMDNSSAIGGRSLVRSSPQYAFANVSMEAVLLENGTLTSPMPQTLSLIRQLLGPFGSVDMRYIPCPQVAKSAVNDIYSAVRRTLAMGNATQTDFSLISDPSSASMPVPKAWTDLNFVGVGGTPLCQDLPVASSPPVSRGMMTLLSWDMQCTSVGTWTFVAPTRLSLIAAVVLSEMTHATSAAIDATCAQNAQYVPACLAYLNQTTAFVTNHMQAELPALQVLPAKAKAAIQALNIEFLQFGMDNASAPVVLYRLRVLEPSETAFELFAWEFLIDWAMGFREVVSFQGDTSSMALMSEYLRPLQIPVNVADTPINFAVYMRSAVLYITIAMIAVAAMALVFVLLSRGHIEAQNLLELNRVGAIVWVGRPLLFVRGLTAIGLLSTCTLQLHYTGYITQFEVAVDPWYKTVLAANEVTWMVAIVNDIAMAVTQEYTFYYSTVNSLLVWLVAAVLSFVAPVNHSVTIAKKCAVVQVDAQVVCTSGDVVIGHVSRLVTLFVLVFVCNVLCYGATRVFMRKKPPVRHVTSSFLCAGARYLFYQNKWVYNDIYYMDRMSAALNGIITLRWNNTVLALDTKLWRMFHVELGDAADIPPSHSKASAFRHALPLATSKD